MYFLLLIPSLFDLCATALCMLGLLHVEVSIYQMLRGSAIIFVAILKHFVLKDKLRDFMWVGVGWNVVSIILVGMTAMFSGGGGEGDDGKDPVKGVCLILAGAFVQSLQYAFEEKVMSMEISAPPLLLIGMEGFWGTVVCIFVLYPICYALPGADVGGTMENPYDTIAMMQNSAELRQVSRGDP
jgi:drug/metabolite transporter (DMT)-like permease